MKLSLDDTLKIADAAYPIRPSKAWDENGYQVDWMDLFEPTSPDTAIRLIENLELDVGKDIGNVWRASKSNGQHTKWRETLADAILECSMAVING